MVRTPRLELKAYEAQEAKALRAVRATKHSWVVKASRKFIESEIGHVVSFLGLIPGAFVFAVCVIENVFLVPGIIAVSPLSVGLAALSIALPSKIREWKALDAMYVASAKDVDGEIQSWLQYNYGLNGRDYDIEDALTGANSIPIDLYTADGGVKITVEAKLNRLEDGSYDLRKTGVKDATESIYFTPISGKELTASRHTPLALTAERS